MGSLIIPSSGTVYADANVFIYTVQEHPVYGPLLIPLWNAVQQANLLVVTSELTLLEILTGTYRTDDSPLASAYEHFLSHPAISLVPISRDVLRSAARFRAETRLRTPDAIHAATAHSEGCQTLITYDPDFRRLGRRPVQILDDLL